MPTNSLTMEKSQFESAAFGLHFFRADEEFLLKDISEQRNIIASNSVDVAKFSIDSTKQDFSERLKAVFPSVTFFNAILNYHKDTTLIEAFPIENDCELVDAISSDAEVIRQLVSDIFEQNTVGYHKIPFLSKTIKATQELEAMQLFILSLLAKPDKGIQFLKMKSDNTIIGFTTYSISDGIVYRAYAGIIQAYRNINYYEQLIYAMISYNYRHQLKAITFGVRADNVPIINKYNRLGGKITSIDYIYIASV